MAERKPSPPRSKFVEVNGVKLHYLEWPGPGRPLVFLHANSYCGGVWSPLAARLSDSFCVFALDMRGHGLSDKPETGYDWGSLRDDLVGLLQSLDLRETLLVGHSRGGGATVLTAAACPERVRGLLVYEPNIAPLRVLSEQEDSNRMPIDAIVARAMRRRTVFTSRQELFDRYSQENALKQWKDECLWAYIEHGTALHDDGQAELLCPPWVEAQYYREMLRTDAWTEMRPLQLPTLLCHGDSRPAMGPGHGLLEGLRSVAPQCQVVTMSGATHFGPMEQPETFEVIIREFASSLD